MLPPRTRSFAPIARVTTLGPNDFTLGSSLATRSSVV
jgi:hypothetical protein